MGEEADRACTNGRRGLNTLFDLQPRILTAAVGVSLK